MTEESEKKKKAEYSPRGSRRLPSIVIDAPVHPKTVAKARAILRRCVQDWGVAVVVLTPNGEMMAHKPSELAKTPRWWMANYGKGFTTKMIRADIEFQLVEIRRFHGIREKWDR